MTDPQTSTQASSRVNVEVDADLARAVDIYIASRGIRKKQFVADALAAALPEGLVAAVRRSMEEGSGELHLPLGQ